MWLCGRSHKQGAACRLCGTAGGLAAAAVRTVPADVAMVDISKAGTPLKVAAGAAYSECQSLASGMVCCAAG